MNNDSGVNSWWEYWFTTIKQYPPDAVVTEAIANHLNELAGLPVVLWENADHGENADVLPRLEAGLFVNAPQVFSNGGRHRRRYIFQVTVVVAEHTGQWAARSYADTISAGFDWNTTIGSLSPSRLFVYNRPSASNAIKEKAEWRLPVSIYLELVE